MGRVLAWRSRRLEGEVPRGTAVRLYADVTKTRERGPALIVTLPVRHQPRLLRFVVSNPHLGNLATATSSTIQVSSIPKSKQCAQSRNELAQPCDHFQKALHLHPALDCSVRVASARARASACRSLQQQVVRACGRAPERCRACPGGTAATARGSLRARAA